MARNRMIKPEFWEDDKIAECSTTARLLFVALWNFADDEGYLEYRLKWLKTKCFPYDNLKIDVLLQELLKVGRIEIQNNIIHVKNFLKHQKIDRPKPSNLSVLFNISTNDRRMIDEPSTTKEKGIEVNISEQKCEDSLFSDENKIPPKKTYLEFVKLTNEEYEKLVNLTDNVITSQYIERLNDYIGSKGVKYKSHYHAIKGWMNKDRGAGLLLTKKQFYVKELSLLGMAAFIRKYGVETYNSTVV